MYTYQDLLEKGDGDKARMDFVGSVIKEHKQSNDYKTAEIAEEYLRHRNRTITQYQKLLYTISGQTVPDNYSANFKIAHDFFKRFVTQQNQFLLGNGVTWEDAGTADKVGKRFDFMLQKAGKYALTHGVSFGFFNRDHLDVFSLLEFAPLYDEENGALMAGVRFWQIDKTKPLRATLYEVDGYTNYMWKNGKGEILQAKRAYKINVSYSEIDGLEIYDGENYPTFPIVPLWGNPEKQSEIIGMREQIDAYDLIKSGFANDLDDVSQIYWTISNAGGMDDIDLAQFVQRMKTVKAAAVQDGEQAQAHTIDIPYNARETLLDRLRRDMYRDYRALDTEAIANGAVTATQIRAAYEAMVGKADEYEYCVLDFIRGLMEIAGIEDEPTFTRSLIINQSEELQNLIALAQFLPADYIITKILTTLGDADKVEEVLKQLSEKEQEQAFMAEEADMVEDEEEGGDVGAALDELVSMLEEDE